MICKIKKYTDDTPQRKVTRSGYMDKEYLYDSEDGTNIILKFDVNNRLLHLYEYIASELARVIGVPSQRTYLANRLYSTGVTANCVAIEEFDNKLYLVSNKLTHLTNNNDTINVSLVEKWSPKYTLDYLLERYPGVTNRKKWIEDVSKIILFDIVIGNKDRHQSNIGFFNVKGNIELAPAFDNGNAFMNNSRKYIKAEQVNFKDLKTAFWDSNSGGNLKETDALKILSNYIEYPLSKLNELFRYAKLSKDLDDILKCAVKYNKQYTDVCINIRNYIKLKGDFYATYKLA